MKILFVCLSMSDHWGGPPKVIRDLAEQFQNKNHNVQIFSMQTKDDNYSFSYKNLTLYKTSFLNSIWKGFSLKIIFPLLKEIKNNKVVHIHELWHFPSFLAGLYCIALSKPFFISTHGEMEKDHFNTKRIKKIIFFKLFQKNLMLKAKKIFCLNNYEADHLKSLANSIKIEVIGNGITIPNIVKSYKSKNNLPSEYILFLGRLHKTKGCDLLINAFPSVLKKYPHFKLIIVGPDFGEKKNLTIIVSNLGLSNSIIFTGPIFSDEKTNLIKNAKLLVCPSRSEGFGMVILEALSLGVHVVVTSACGVLGIEENKVGKISAINSESIATNILNKLNEGNYSKKLAIKFIRDNYDNAIIASKYLKYYEEYCTAS